MNWPISEPSWALPLAAVAIALLLAALIGLIALPLTRPVKTAFDPHEEPFGDQPKLPRDRKTS